MSHVSIFKPRTLRYLSVPCIQQLKNLRCGLLHFPYTCRGSRLAADLTKLVNDLLMKVCALSHLDHATFVQPSMRSKAIVKPSKSNGPFRYCNLALQTDTPTRHSDCSMVQADFFTEERALKARRNFTSEAFLPKLSLESLRFFHFLLEPLGSFLFMRHRGWNWVNWLTLHGGAPVFIVWSWRKRRRIWFCTCIWIWIDNFRTFIAVENVRFLRFLFSWRFLLHCCFFHSWFWLPWLPCHLHAKRQLSWRWLCHSSLGRWNVPAVTQRVGYSNKFASLQPFDRVIPNLHLNLDLWSGGVIQTTGTLQKIIYVVFEKLSRCANLGNLGNSIFQNKLNPISRIEACAHECLKLRLLQGHSKKANNGPTCEIWFEAQEIARFHIVLAQGIWKVLKHCIECEGVRTLGATFMPTLGTKINLWITCRRRRSMDCVFQKSVDVFICCCQINWRLANRSITWNEWAKAAKGKMKAWLCQWPVAIAQQKPSLQHAANITYPILSCTYKNSKNVIRRPD